MRCASTSCISRAMRARSAPWACATRSDCSASAACARSRRVASSSRRELLATLRDRAHAAEAEQSLRVAQAQGAERARIAREMHDVLAHRISMVAMHAGALAYRTDLSVDEIQRTSSIIQENAHRALVDLRVVLGILRDGPDDSAPELPQPSISDLASLIAEARSTGLTIDV